MFLLYLPRPIRCGGRRCDQHRDVGGGLCDRLRQDRPRRRYSDPPRCPNPSHPLRGLRDDEQLVERHTFRAPAQVLRALLAQK